MKLTRIIIVIAVIGLIVGIAMWPSDQQETRKTVGKFRVGAYAGDTAALVWIADQQGYFRDHQLDITIIPYEAGKLAMDALLAGEVDIATAAEFVFVSNSFAYSDLRIFGNIAKVQINEVVARRDHGIQIPCDLQGKRIGVTRKSASEFYLGRFLLFHGLCIREIEVVDLNPSEIVAAMIAGEIDAALTWNPNVYEIKQQLGDTAVSWPGQSDQEMFFVLAAKAPWLAWHPAPVERFLHALLEAEAFVQAHDAAAQQQIQEQFAYAADYMHYIWPKHQFRLTLPQSLLIAMEDEARWRLHNHLADRATSIPNYFTKLYFQGLEAVKPEALTVIR
ncbi:hypothetical protein GF339_15275 [candidate division KSB3 bacterium]|uniref:Solute-binding protein family 3/N-terminal domain-containing protein n=1 Tax=candidate division KSB3 bacterium TaxID=2044937 RepID=A0A9D5Q752_9BACT|nr:hypothetical protein [candidate division KSB3 bacterium]MBD3325947.1 hypothetical protein [candidate division KSB3 bacterium]